MYRNLVITGGRTQENPPLGPAGDVRAWDIHTGKLVWTFRSIPRAGEKFNDTWAGDSWKNRSGVNVWGFITVDIQRGIVYMPFGAPSVDQYGGDRAGDNLFGTASSLPTRTPGSISGTSRSCTTTSGTRILSAAPALIDVKQGGKTIPAVAVINKPGLLFLLDRVTGKPIYGVEERPVPPSEVPLERAAKTQPFPLKPPPLSRMTMTMADIATVTPELEAACRKLIEGVQIGGPYLPQGYKRLRLQFPGNHGGVNWGGVSFNPAARVLVRQHQRARPTRGRDGSRSCRRRALRKAPGRAIACILTVHTRACRRRAIQGRREQHDVPAAAVGTVDRGRREHRRVRVARAARDHRKPAA